MEYQNRQYLIQNKLTGHICPSSLHDVWTKTEWYTSASSPCIFYNHVLDKKINKKKKNIDTITLHTIKEAGLDAAAVSTLQSLRGQEASANCNGSQAAYTFTFLHLNAEQNQDIKTAINNFNISRCSN